MQVQDGLLSASDFSQPVPAPREETISSSEFDRFLEERAAAADALPTITAATGSSAPRQRTLARDDKDTNQMFALWDS